MIFCLFQLFDEVQCPQLMVTAGRKKHDFEFFRISLADLWSKFTLYSYKSYGQFLIFEGDDDENEKLGGLANKVWR